MAWVDFYDERNWTTKPAHTYVAREVWFPLAHAVCSWEDEFHTLMLHDYVRMEAFRRAIRQAVGHLLGQRGPGDEPVRILDIGTGYGILAFWAAEAASDRELVPNPNPGVRVYAVEANPVTASRAVRELGAKKLLWEGDGDPANKILVFNVPSYRLNRALVANQPVLERFDPHLPNASAFPLAAFDLVVSETLGNIGDNEDGVRLLHHAALSFLKPGGHVIPAEVTSYLVPIADVDSTPASISLHDSVRAAESGTVEAVKTVSAEYQQKLPTNCFNMVYDAVVPRSDYLSQPQKVKHWQFAPQQAKGPTEYNYTILMDEPQSSAKLDASGSDTAKEPKPFTCDRAGRFIGFKGYFTAVLWSGGEASPKVTLEIESEDIKGRNTSDCWKHCYLPIAQPIEVATGDSIGVSFQRMVKEPKHEVFTYIWKGTVKRHSDVVGDFRQNYTANTPYHHATDPVGRSLRSFAVNLEWNHFAQQVLPDDDDKLVKLLQDALRGQSPQDIAFPWKSSIQPTDSQEEQMRKYLPALSSKLDGCSLGFRFGKPGEFLWVTTEQLLPGPPDDPGWELRYVVDERFTEGPDFVSVVRLPYSKQAWEDWREQAWGARRTTNEEAKTPTFAASLVIPATTPVRDLLLAGDEELEGLMNFLQVHVFTNILIDLTVQFATAKERAEKEELRASLGAGLYHQLGQLIEALGQSISSGSQLEGLVLRMRRFRQLAYDTITGATRKRPPGPTPALDVIVADALNTAYCAHFTNPYSPLSTPRSYRELESKFSNLPEPISLEVDWCLLQNVGSTDEDLYGFVLQELFVNALKGLGGRADRRVVQVSLVTADSESLPYLVLKNSIDADEYQELSRREFDASMRPAPRVVSGWGRHGVWAYFKHVYDIDLRTKLGPQLIRDTGNDIFYAQSMVPIVSEPHQYSVSPST